MVEVNTSLETGDQIRIRYEVIEYRPDGTEEKTEREETGTITAKPSRKFDWPSDTFDFDYEIPNGNAVRSVDIENGKVAQLMYDAGGDRDWDSWNLITITRLA